MEQSLNMKINQQIIQDYNNTGYEMPTPEELELGRRVEQMVNDYKAMASHSAVEFEPKLFDHATVRQLEFSPELTAVALANLKDNRERRTPKSYRIQWSQKGDGTVWGMYLSDDGNYYWESTEVEVEDAMIALEAGTVQGPNLTFGNGTNDDELVVPNAKNHTFFEKSS